MPARAKLTRRRERRLIALLEAGESLAAACRAIDVSAEAVRRKAIRDPMFSARVAAARGGRAPTRRPLDWLIARKQLEHQHPQRWARSDPDDLPPDPDLDEIPPDIAAAPGPWTISGVDRETGEVFESQIEPGLLASSLASARRLRERDDD